MPTRMLTSLALAAVVALPGTAIAAGQNFGTHLTGQAEVPSNDSKAQGQANFQLSADGSTVSYRLIVSNIDNVFGAHIHCPAEEDQNAGVAVTLYSDPEGAGSGRHNGVLATGEFSTSETCPGGMNVLDAMRAGLAYVNVHTDDGEDPPNTGPGDFPGGEIRGQIEARGPSN